MGKFGVKHAAGIVLDDEEHASAVVDRMDCR